MITDIFYFASNESAFFKKAAQLVCETAAQAVRERNLFTLVLSGGKTPRKLFSLLAEPYYQERVPWANTHVFWGDERCVPPDHPESNYGAAHAELFSKINFPETRVHRMRGEMESPLEAARAYEHELKAFFKLDKSLPHFDLVMLGVGEDGHVASLFPGTTAVKEKLKWATANFVDRLSANRLTLTLPLINNARRVLFLCSGESKSGIIRDIFRDDLPPDRYPVQLVVPVGGERIWLMDKAAAAKLPGSFHNKASHIG